MKMKKFNLNKSLSVISVLTLILLITSCSSQFEKNQSSNNIGDEGNISEEHLEAETFEVRGARYVLDSLQVLVFENNSLEYYLAENKDNTLTLVEKLDKTQSDIPSEHEINGYLEGKIRWKISNDGRLEIYFIDNELGKHLDLFALTLNEGEELWDLKVAKDFSRINYHILSGEDLSSYTYSLDSNEIVEHPDAILFSSEGILGNIKANSNDNSVFLTWENTEIDSSKPVIQTFYDVVIEDGIVVDPETNTMKFNYNVGIIGDKIEIITKAKLDGNRKINARGLIVSPGFIDMLSFNLNTVSSKFKITDGVTTALSMHGCTEDFRGFFRKYEKNPVYVNYGGAVFAIRLRFEQGLSGTGAPTTAQIGKMAKRVGEEIEAGGLALAFSPEYYPGTTSEEITKMMEVAALYDVPTHFHARYSAVKGDFTGIDGVYEILDYAKLLDAKVHFMHLHSTGGTGMMQEALDVIEEAKKQGFKISYDIYPYDFWISRIQMERYRPGWQERYGITYSDLQMAGTKERLTKESFDYYRTVGGLCIAYAMNEEEIVLALSQEDAMVGSDETISSELTLDSHPRGAGTFSKILGQYVREENHFSLMEGLRKMTINSAMHLEDISEDMALRGRLQEGKIADITIFDYRTIIDRATVENPAATSIGIEYVLVSGTVAVDRGKLISSAKFGKPIKSDYAKKN